MGENGTLWLPESASTLAPEIDSLFYFVYWVSVILFAMVMLGMVYFVVKYRRRRSDERPELVHESKLLEAAWIVVPTILVLVVFTWGFRLFVRQNVAPPGSYEIQVEAKMWLWDFRYPNGVSSPGELHVPVGRPVKLNMSSQDVIHSFFVPEFRVKHDVLPNRYTSVWFQATRPGEYQVYCTEYCGTQHSGMLAKVVVHTEEEFAEWLQTGGGVGDLPPVEYGALLYTQQACATCHSVDGTQKVGPTFQGLFGKQEQLADGSSVTVDENYLRESIIAPQAKIVAGYQPVMPPYASLNEQQLTALIAFIKEQ